MQTLLALCLPSRRMNKQTKTLDDERPRSSLFKFFQAAEVGRAKAKETRRETRNP